MIIAFPKVVILVERALGNRNESTPDRKHENPTGEVTSKGSPSSAVPHSFPPWSSGTLRVLLNRWQMLSKQAAPRSKRLAWRAAVVGASESEMITTRARSPMTLSEKTAPATGSSSQPPEHPTKENTAVGKLCGRGVCSIHLETKLTTSGPWRRQAGLVHQAAGRSRRPTGRDAKIIRIGCLIVTCMVAIATKTRTPVAHTVSASIIAKQVASSSQVAQVNAAPLLTFGDDPQKK